MIVRNAHVNRTDPNCSQITCQSWRPKRKNLFFPLLKSRSNPAEDARHLIDSTRRYQSRRVWRAGYGAGANQRLKPDIFRDALRRRWDTKGALQLVTVFRIG